MLGLESTVFKRTLTTLLWDCYEIAVFSLSGGVVLHKQLCFCSLKLSPSPTGVIGDRLNLLIGHD